MATIYIDKTNWTWKRFVKHFILDFFGKSVLKVNDRVNKSSIRIGMSTTLGQCLTITLMGGKMLLKLGATVT